MKSKARYAVYFAPTQGSELERICASILGRCARTGKILKQVEFPGINASRLAELTASPRHYGFHGTLKPPFFLAEGTDETDLLTATASLAAGRKAFDLPPLRIETIGSFLALTPSAPCPELEALARACITELDRFRRPPSPEELARRRANGLSPAQDRLLEQWGYPYVLEEFRFHLTLTGKITDPAKRDEVRDKLAGVLASVLEQTASVREIIVFQQPATTEPFTALSGFALASPQ